MIIEIKPTKIEVNVNNAGANVSVEKQLTPIPDDYTKFVWNGEYITLL